jgi:hypothetical protein
MKELEDKVIRLEDVLKNQLGSNINLLNRLRLASKFAIFFVLQFVAKYSSYKEQCQII